MSLVEVSNLGDGIAKVALNRPDKMNALNLEMFSAIIDSGEILARDNGLRAIVLCGNGNAFCAGLDLNIMGQFAQIIDSLHERTHKDCNQFQRAAMIWHDIDAPVICAINGVAFGGGLQIASGADIRIAAPDAKLSIMEMKWGIIPDMGGTYLWPKNVRNDVLKHLTMSAEIIDANQAQSVGLISEIAENPIDAAINYAKTLKGKSIAALKAQKRLYNGVDANARSRQLLNESIEQAEILKGLIR